MLFHMNSNFGGFFTTVYELQCDRGNVKIDKLMERWKGIKKFYIPRRTDITKTATIVR